MDGEKPPCESCSHRQPTLYTSNALAWDVWASLNEFDRPMDGMGGFFKIPSIAMVQMVELAEGDETDLMKVKLIERLMYPVLLEQWQNASKK